MANDFRAGSFSNSDTIDPYEAEQRLKETAKLFIQNHEILRSLISARDPRIYMACAVLFTARGMRADTLRLQTYQSILRKRFGVFSSFRGMIEPVLLTNMILHGSPERYLTEIEQILNTMGGRIEKEYSILAAMIIAGQEDLSAADAVARTQDLYSRMRALWPVITSAEDLPQTAMLAVTGKDPRQLIADTQTCMELLKRFTAKNTLQAISLSLGLINEAPQTKCDRFRALHTACQNHRIVFERGLGMAVPATLLLLDLPYDTIAKQIAQAASILQNTKGFGPAMTGGKATRNLFAAALVLIANTDVCEETPAAADTTAAFIIQLINMEMAAAASALITSSTASTIN